VSQIAREASRLQRAYAGAFALVGWFAVVGQYVVGRDFDLASTIDYFSYFTHLSNILVALTLSAAAVAPASPLGRWLLRPATALATVTYITITGLTYRFLLASLYDLSGWTLFFDRLLHYVMPPAFVLFWLVCVPKGRLTASNVLWMLVPPLVYAAYTFIHGPWTGFYPYPFVDLAKLGVLLTARNVLGFIVFFTLVGALFLLIDRAIARLRRDAPG
jgi:hypothetical protein